MNKQPTRRSIRLKGYDYSQSGIYVVTLCIQERHCLFGSITHETMILNDAGKMIDEQWLQLQERFALIQLDEYVIMPNHFHGIIIVGAGLVPAREATATANFYGRVQGPPLQNPHLSQIVGAFKSITTHQYILGVKNQQWKPFNGKLWQRNYYEHIIRNEESFFSAKEYIMCNPQNWKTDKMNPNPLKK